MSRTVGRDVDRIHVMRTSEDVAGGPSVAIRDALAGADSDGRLPPANARVLRTGLDVFGAGTPPAALWSPERLLGAFEALPLGVQRSLIRELQENERWHLRALELGDWHVAAVRLLKSPGFRRLAGGFA